MDHWITVAYVGIVILSFIVFCCGDWPIFERTIVQRLNKCCTGGGFDLLEKVVGSVCGESGRRAVASVEHYCCEHPNPILQLFYCTILWGTLFAFVNTSFEYIPGHYLSSTHRYVGIGSVILGFLLFLVTSYSDPGIITAANVSEYLSIYPYDGVLYEEKVCATCNIIRPARSKHCRICGRCIARFDHHCGWTNTCIGEKNLRFFLMFLFWHCCLCCYGAWVMAAILAGEVKKRNVVRLLTMYFGVERSVRKLSPHIFQWLLAFYNAQLLILLFLSAILLLLIGFLGYHLYLVLINTTTNETFKWESYRRWKTDVLEYEDLNNAQIKQNATIAAIPSCENVAKKRFRIVCSFPSFFRKQSSAQRVFIERENIYNKGIFHNINEVISPRSCRLSFQNVSIQKSKKM